LRLEYDGVVFIIMLQAGTLSHALASVVKNVQSTDQWNLFSHAREPLMIMFVTSDGQLLSSSVSSDSEHGDVTQRVSAVAASIAVEYKAMDRLMGEDFKALNLSTEVRNVLCSHFCDLMDSGSVFLVISLPENAGVSEILRLGFLRSLSDRIKTDLFPSLGPIMGNMISAPPTE
jgi:hypothetical protein